MKFILGARIRITVIDIHLVNATAQLLTGIAAFIVSPIGDSKEAIRHRAHRF